MTDPKPTKKPPVVHNHYSLIPASQSCSEAGCIATVGFWILVAFLAYMDKLPW
jgi:hypothetical protein